jgi:uncharacterized protein (TIGR02996 family)
MTHDDFLRAILAEPGDDGLRLVYADWLDERDDPRGAYLRIEVELADRPGEEPPVVRRLRRLRLVEPRHLRTQGRHAQDLRRRQ